MSSILSRTGRLLASIGRRSATACSTHAECRIVVFAMAFRLFSALLAFLSNVMYPLAQDEPFTVLGRTHLMWDTFARYDSGWYFGIARYGYDFVEGGRNNLAFFPLYPMLMRYGGLALGGGRQNIYLAGIIVSWTAFVVACILLYRLARHYVSDADAERAVTYAAVFPFAFFYGVVYTEALYLMLAVGAFLAFRTRRWVLGGLAGAALSATRVNGILILPALAWLAWQQAGGDRTDRRRALLGVALIPLGIGLYASYVYTLSGSFLEWMYSITRWNSYVPGGAPWTALTNVIWALATHPYDWLVLTDTAPYDLLNASAVFFALAMIPFVWRRMGWPYALWMALSLWLPLSSGVLEGTGRYCAVLFPMFICLGPTNSRLGRQSILIAFASLYMLCRSLFTNLHPLF